MHDIVIKIKTNVLNLFYFLNKSIFMCLMLNNENVFVISNAFRFSIDFEINIYIGRMTYFFIVFTKLTFLATSKTKKLFQR